MALLLYGNRHGISPLPTPRKAGHISLHQTQGSSILRVVESYGYDVTALLIALGSFVMIVTKRLPPVAVLGVAAVIGAVVYR